MTRKEFVVAVTEQLQAEPRAVLAGHGIQSAILKEIAIRPDVMGKLAAFTFMTNNFKKGAKGLKKSSDFKITGYKNFAEFNMKARTDVESFVAGLSPVDADEFENNENIITMLILPDTKTDNMESDIANGKSVVTKFDTAVKKEYKINGGFYLTIMFGNSLIRGVEENKAESKAKQNAKLVAVKQASASKLKAELVAKAKAKAAKIAEVTSKLAGKAAGLGAELEQFGSLADEFGATSTNPRNVLAAMKRYTVETKRFLAKLNPAEKLVYTEAMKAMKKGNIQKVNQLLVGLGNDQLTAIVKGGNLTDADAKLTARKLEIKKQIKLLDQKNEALLAKLEAAPTPRAKAQIRFDMKKIATKVNILKSKLGVYKDLTPAAIKSKADLLKSTNAMIADNIAKGATVQQALNAALGKLPATEEIKQQIKEQVIQQIANGTPTQYAVQQAIQQVPTAELQIQQLPVEEIDEPEFEQALIDVMGNDGVDDSYQASLAGSASIKAILDFI